MEDFNSKYTGAEVEELLDQMADKLDKTEQAADSAKLGGVEATEYMQKSGGTFTGDITAPKFIGALARPLQDHGTGDTTFTLTPNILHQWDTVSSLTLTLGGGVDGAVNEYTFQFTSGTTATTLSLPSSVKFPSELTIEANKIYQISIVNNLALISSWDA